MKQRVTVTQEQADALNAHQQKMTAATVALRQNFGALLQVGEVEKEVERLNENIEAGTVTELGLGLAMRLRDFQEMLGAEISNGIGVILRNRAKLREVLGATGLLEAAEAGTLDDVEIMVSVSNPSFSQTPADG